ncbi:Hypothetical protein DEACI_2951 [Acididesulfobacillus acetoxydans]|uniref:Uncharacterized protein n=1 Tax=Acididesulfobacillus acetoxydans TaxID=1561005 RepID=A0A8S0XYS3_9FIRM|nr:cleavage protein [Acididesulfobacillus acetoxydans]CAA7602277.1 Hypothetical protein DEACI_2951 [Acididesulfobacillus acetoxydans]CEJ07505.1 Hypothetical protein DEACI_1971 [Acididesulfobacillus acetoxydans]
MTRKLCQAGCLYAIDGRCRLEYRLGEHEPVCPFFEKDIQSYHGGANR